MQFIIAFLIFSFSAFSERQKVDPISFGVVKLAEDRMPVKAHSFKVTTKGKFEVSAAMVNDSVQWVRLDRSLLVPRALLDVSFKAEAVHQFSWQYAHQKIIPLYDEKNGVYKARIFVSLFESIPLELLEEDKIVNVIRVLPTKELRSHLIDYSCAPYSLEVEGIKDDFLSVGCKIQRTGKFGEERPYLEVMVTSASYRLKDQSGPPYLMVFHETGESKISLKNHEGKEEVITIKAKVPEKLPRLNLAAGFGPYTLDTRDKSARRKSQMAPTVMLYGNLSLNDSSSLRFFDSYSKNISTFHNWGVYFAWDLAQFCDQRCLLTSLIGVQGVDYRYNSIATSRSEIIYPQGFEFIYKHPFSQLNYRFSYGMFASFSGLYNYQNYWIRYGKGWFWELNYIEWKRDNEQATMFGLSFGLPIARFF